jgi:hypothetical protein
MLQQGRCIAQHNPLYTVSILDDVAAVGYQLAQTPRHIPAETKADKRCQQ